jgi:hypothetical protein
MKSGYLPLPHMMQCKTCNNETPHELVGTRWICMFCTRRQRLEKEYQEDRRKLTKPLSGTQVGFDWGLEEK